MAKSLEILIQEKFTELQSLGHKGERAVDKIMSLKAGGKRLPIETQLQMAESELTELRGSGVTPIRRNNGQGTPLTEAELNSLGKGQAVISEADKTLFNHLGMNVEQVERAAGAVPVRAGFTTVEATQYAAYRASGFDEATAVSGRESN
jgi:hypothetical protein